MHALVEGFLVAFAQEEIQVSWVMLQDDEQIAILIDRLNNKARLYVPVEECQKLALQHQYELVGSREIETFVNGIGQILRLP